MRNIIKTVFALLFMVSCSTRVDQNIVNKQKQYTIIFDFDDTIYTKNQNHHSYLSAIYVNAIKRTKYVPEDMFKYIHDNNLYTTKAAQTIPKLAKLLTKFNFQFKQEDIDYSVKRLNIAQTPGLGNIITQLTQQGYHVLIVGGGVFGCASIPEFIEQFGIQRKDVYSGYYKDFSKKSLDKIISMPWAYVNCADPDNVNTVYSENKSDLIKSLKEQNKINKNNKVIHIGDGANDLEVYESKQADVFIGFGINRIDKTVQKKAPIFIRTIGEFEEELNRLLK